MTIANAIQLARAGEKDGFAAIFAYTIPHVWLAANMLGCARCGTAAVEIYQQALSSLSSLRSPSDLRVWLGKLAYPVLLQQKSPIGLDMPALPHTLQEIYAVMKKLPEEERIALLVMCGEGCSAPQASAILSMPDIEIKRAMRRARQTIAAAMKELGIEDSCNTTWLIQKLEEMRLMQSEQAVDIQKQVLHCVQSGEAFVEPEIKAPVEPESKEMMQQEEPEESLDSLSTPEKDQENEPKPEEKGGFFQKLFRSRRLG